MEFSFHISNLNPFADFVFEDHLSCDNIPDERGVDDTETHLTSVHAVVLPLPEKQPDSCQSSSRSEKVLCGHCNEHSLVYFHDHHVRICQSNPNNFRAKAISPVKGPRDDGEQTAACGFCGSVKKIKHLEAHKQLCIKNPEAQARRLAEQELEYELKNGTATCKFCQETCSKMYKDGHQRICSKNPDNIKTTCLHCRRIFGLTSYKSHLQACRDYYGIHHCGKSSGDLEKKEIDGECAICLEKFQARTDIAKVPCSHMFHRKCLQKWAQTKKQCPLCRTGFF